MYISFSDKVFGLPITTLDCHCGCSFQAFKSWDFYSWRSNIIVLCGYHGDIYPLFTYVIAFQQCFLYHLPFLKKDTVQKWRKVVAVFFYGIHFSRGGAPAKFLELLVSKESDVENSAAACSFNGLPSGKDRNLTSPTDPYCINGSAMFDYQRVYDSTIIIVYSMGLATVCRSSTYFLCGVYGHDCRAQGISNFWGISIPHRWHNKYCM